VSQFKVKVPNPYQYSHVINVNKQWEHWINNMLSKIRRMKMAGWLLIYIVVIWTMILITVLLIQRPQTRLEEIAGRIERWNDLIDKVDDTHRTVSQLVLSLSPLLSPLENNPVNRKKGY